MDLFNAVSNTVRWVIYYDAYVCVRALTHSKLSEAAKSIISPELFPFPEWHQSKFVTILKINK